MSFSEAQLQEIFRRFRDDPSHDLWLRGRNEAYARFRVLFKKENLESLTAGDIKDFLSYDGDRAWWTGLARPRAYLLQKKQKYWIRYTPKP